MKKPLAIIFLAIFFPLSTSAALNPAEETITHYIQAHQAEQQALLKKLVSINSGTTNISSVDKVGEILRPQFQALGFKTYWVQEPAGMKRAGTLIAEHPGFQAKKILLIGHMDTVFPKDSRFQHYENQGKTATGPGVIDDKGGVVVLLYALKALQSAQLLKDENITVVLTGDEEDSGKPVLISRKPLQDAARGAAVALDFEWALANDTATIARRGITNWVLQTRGQEAHSSEIFQPNAGANYELARILNEFRLNFVAEKYLSINPGVMLGGHDLSFDKNTSQGTVSGKGNVIAKAGLVKGDLRYLSEEQKNKAQAKMQGIVKQHLPGTSAEIQFQEGIPAMPLTRANQELLQQYSQVSQDLGQGAITAVDPGQRGAGDISHIASKVPACLAGIGAVGTGAHSEKETLDVGSLVTQAQRAAVLINRLSS